MNFALADFQIVAGFDMTWDNFYFICFGVGLALCFLSTFAGMGHMHGGHFGHAAHGAARGLGKHAGRGAMSALNGFTLTAFLCWFGGTGYLLHHFSVFVMPLVLLLAVLSGLAGAGLIWWALVKILMPQERVLESSDTEMTGMVGRVSDRIRGDGVGEILFSQLGARRSAAARSEDGSPIERGTEVIVMRYERGVAYVRRWDDLADGMSGEGPGAEAAERARARTSG